MCLAVEPLRLTRQRRVSLSERLKAKLATSLRRRTRRKCWRAIAGGRLRSDLGDLYERSRDFGRTLTASNPIIVVQSLPRIGFEKGRVILLSGIGLGIDERQEQILSAWSELEFPFHQVVLQQLSGHRNSRSPVDGRVHQRTPRGPFAWLHEHRSRASRLSDFLEAVVVVRDFLQAPHRPQELVHVEHAIEVEHHTPSHQTGTNVAGSSFGCCQFRRTRRLGSADLDVRESPGN